MALPLHVICSKKLLPFIILCCCASTTFRTIAQTLNADKQDTSIFLLSISTYNHAEQIFSGKTIYDLTDKQLTISRIAMLSVKGDSSNKKYLLKSIGFENNVVQQIKDIRLDTLKDFYYNYCVMATSGSEYFISITNGASTKKIMLHHYYNKQIDKLIAIVNKIVAGEYELIYVPSNNEQGCK